MPHFCIFSVLGNWPNFIFSLNFTLSPICCIYTWYFVLPFQFVHSLAFLYPIFCLSACLYFCIQSFVSLPVYIFVSNLLFICLYVFLFPIFCLSVCTYFCIQSFVYLPVSSSILQLCAIFFPGLTLPPCPLHCNCLSSFFFFSFSSVAFFFYSHRFSSYILPFSFLSITLQSPLPHFSFFLHLLFLFRPSYFLLCILLHIEEWEKM